MTDKPKTAPDSELAQRTKQLAKDLLDVLQNPDPEYAAERAAYEEQKAKDDEASILAYHARRKAAAASKRANEIVGADATGARLDGLVLTGARLERVSFVGANVTYTSLDASELLGCDFKGARISSALFTGSTLSDCVFEGARGGRTNFVSATITSCSFVRAGLDGSTWERGRRRQRHRDTAGLARATRPLTGVVQQRVVDHFGIRARRTGPPHLGQMSVSPPLSEMRPSVRALP